MTRVVIDASAGVEILTDTARGRRLRRLIPRNFDEWVPHHFYSEVLGVLRRQSVIRRSITEISAAHALARLENWPLKRADIHPLIRNSWSKRHNMTASDAIYVSLAEDLDAYLLTDDQRLATTPNFPRSVVILRLGN